MMAPAALIGSLVRVIITEIGSNTLFGKLAEPTEMPALAIRNSASLGHGPEVAQSFATSPHRNAMAKFAAGPAPATHSMSRFGSRRFPKFTGKIRDDKGPDDSTSVEEIVEMYNRQLKKIEATQ